MTGRYCRKQERAPPNFFHHLVFSTMIMKRRKEREQIELNHCRHIDYHWDRWVCC
jgi:hypothetical protein